MFTLNSVVQVFKVTEGEFPRDIILYKREYRKMNHFVDLLY